MLEKDIEKILVNEVKKLGGRAYKRVSPGNDGTENGERTAFSVAEGAD